MSNAPFAMHTSDRIAFKRCRRKWYFSSPLHRNLQPQGNDGSIHLWFGSGMHFAMEDYHGHNKFGLPEIALEAYFNAFREGDLPPGADDTITLGMHMLAYYHKWLPRHNFDGLETLWITEDPLTGDVYYTNHPISEFSIPQVEISFTLELEELTAYAGFPVYYHGTFDRVMMDNQGRWWLLDYKTAKTIDTNKLTTDPQIGAYLWAAEQWYQRKIEGIVYLQLAKDYPNPPRILKDGSVSTDKSQKTTHGIFRETLIDMYGQVPPKYIPVLNELASKESIEGDRFIRWDYVRRNDAAKINTYHHILAEGKEMLNTELAIYPNPTRDCMWDCSFRTACIAMDEDSDYELILSNEFELRNETMLGEEPAWRKRIKWPESDRDAI